MTTKKQPLEAVVARVLGVPADTVNDATSPKSLSKWNSLRHVELVVEIEANYGITFSTAEIMGLQSVGALRETIRRRGLTP